MLLVLLKNIAIVIVALPCVACMGLLCWTSLLTLCIFICIFICMLVCFLLNLYILTLYLCLYGFPFYFFMFFLLFVFVCLSFVFVCFSFVFVDGVCSMQADCGVRQASIGGSLQPDVNRFRQLVHRTLDLWWQKKTLAIFFQIKIRSIRRSLLPAVNRFRRVVHPTLDMCWQKKHWLVSIKDCNKNFV